MNERTYVCIDLKSFYASVECMERGLNPLTTNLVVADSSKTEKTICLAVTPSLKGYGVSGRARLYEVVQQVKIANTRRRSKTQGNLIGSSYDVEELKNNPSLAIDYIVATPQMALYVEYSTQVYEIYLKYISQEDIHVYSIDEVFIDVSNYLKTYNLTAKELAKKIILDILKSTGITATAGIGNNLFLAKVSMDIVAKKIAPDKDGVRIAEIDEITYRKLLWNHTPITDIWRVGRGYAKKLESIGIYTMGDVARCSIGGKNKYYNEDLLYKLFGINAELLIDHAWGYEPCTIKDIKNYKPATNCVSSGQVLEEPYPFEMGRLVVREMVDLMVLGLVRKGLVTNQIVLTVGYDINNLNNSYTGEVQTDMYGRKIPKHARGTTNMPKHNSSTKLITEQVMDLYDKIVHKNLLIRRINVTANKIINEKDASKSIQLDFFSLAEEGIQEEKELEKEKSIQKAIIGLQDKYGKNAVLKGINLLDGATAKKRNSQIGGHKA